MTRFTIYNELDHETDKTGKKNMISLYVKDLNNHDHDNFPFPVLAGSMFGTNQFALDTVLEVFYHDKITGHKIGEVYVRTNDEIWEVKSAPNSADPKLVTLIKLPNLK
jgi:hypothetical protein